MTHRPIITTARAIQLAADQGFTVETAADAYLVGAITLTEFLSCGRFCRSGSDRRTDR